MNILYLDLFAGISGDMSLGGFIDLGVDEKVLIDSLKKLNISDEYEIKVYKQAKNGITGTKVDIILIDDHNHSHSHEEHRHSHEEHNHSHEEHNHSHEEHNHSHEEHEHSHNRNLYVIEELIDNSDLSERIKLTSKKIFRYVAEAESKIHGQPIDQVNFHEVGATDSILDIVGTAICLDELDIDRIIASDVQIGTGFVYCQHGWIPVPAPASLEILKEGNVPYYSNGIEEEMVTPTGAAIIAAIVDEFGPMPNMKAKSIGYGVGSRELEIPNVVRMIYGKKKVKKLNQ